MADVIHAPCVCLYHYVTCLLNDCACVSACVNKIFDTDIVVCVCVCVSFKHRPNRIESNEELDNTQKSSLQLDMVIEFFFVMDFNQKRDTHF